MIIEYLKANPRFSLIFLISILVCTLIITLIVIFYKKSKTNILNDLSKNAENCENPSGILDNLANEELPTIKNDNFNNEENTYDTQESFSSADNSNNDNIDEIYSIDQIPTPQTDEYIETSNEELIEDSALEHPLKKEECERPEEEKTEIIKYAGKWIIYEEDGRYFADLKASNGELMLRTESYSSLSGIKSGIETLKKNIELENYAVNLDKNGNFVFKIFSTAKRLLCVGEGYSTREQCEKAFSSVKRFSKTAKICVAEK